MSRTSFSGPLVAGTQDVGSPGGPNMGFCLMTQVAVINRDATLVQSATINLPPNAQIISVASDVNTPYDSATSATLTVGKTAGATDYAGGINVKTGGRATIAFTAAQVAAMGNIGSNTSLVATVTSVGQPTVGQVRVHVTYIQADN